MASPTNHQTEPPRRQPPTPGVMRTGVGVPMPPGSTAGVGTVPLAGIGMLPGTEGGMTAIAPLGPLEPVLIDDMDPILLARLYPEAQAGEAARAAAIAAGEERAAASEFMVASQNEPVVFEGEGVTYDQEARGRGVHPGRPGRNEPPVVQAGAPHAPPPQQPTSPTRQPDDDKKHDKK